jgi:hypothetical protein
MTERLKMPSSSPLQVLSPQDHFLPGQKAQSNVISNWSNGTANGRYLMRDLAVY